MSRGPVWIGITGIAGADEPTAGLALAQSLAAEGRADIRLMALANDALSDGIQSVNAVDEVAVVPSSHTDPAAFVDAVISLARGRRFVLLPGAAADVAALAGRRQALTRAGVRHLLPSPVQVAELAHVALGRQPGLKTPRGLAVDLNDLRTALRRPWRWPAVVRTTDGRIGLTSQLAYLAPLVQGLERPWGKAAVIHDAVVGSEISIAALGDRAGRVRNFVAAQPLLRSDNGALWSAVTTADPAVLGAAGRIVRRLRWTGPLELHLIRDAGGALWFTGATPAFPSWISLTAAADLPLARQYVRAALGAAPVLPQRYRDGLMLSRVAVDLITSIATLGQLASEGAFSHDRHQLRTLRAAVDRQA